jgi:hypothetical protein
MLSARNSDAPKIPSTVSTSTVRVRAPSVSGRVDDLPDAVSDAVPKAPAATRVA